MGNSAIKDNGEVWDYTVFENCPINPKLDIHLFQWLLNIEDKYIATFQHEYVLCGIPLQEPTEEKHAYLRYKDYCWVYLATPDGEWSTAGLFPRSKFKHLLCINPTYQIPNGTDLSLSKLCRRVIYDTYTIYQLLRQVGISIIDMAPYRYRYTDEERRKSKSEISDSLKSIADNVDVLISAREMCHDPRNSISPFFDYESAKAFDNGIGYIKNFKNELSNESISADYSSESDLS